MKRNSCNRLDDNDVIKMDIKRKLVIMEKQMIHHIISGAFRQMKDIKDEVIPNKEHSEIEIHEKTDIMNIIKEKKE